MKIECRDLIKIKELIRKQRTSPIYMCLPAQWEMDSLNERGRMKTVEIYEKTLKDRKRNPYLFFSYYSDTLGFLNA